MLVLDKSIVVMMLAGAIVSRNVLSHDGALVDGAGLTKQILQFCLLNVPRHVCDVQGSPIDVVLPEEFLVRIARRGDGFFVLIVRHNPVVWVLLGDLNNTISI